jgi:hypothetical protein
MHQVVAGVLVDGAVHALYVQAHAVLQAFNDLLHLVGVAGAEGLTRIHKLEVLVELQLEILLHLLLLTLKRLLSLHRGGRVAATTHTEEFGDHISSLLHLGISLGMLEGTDLRGFN